MTLPAPPPRSFASDNAAGAHPSVLAAIERVNVGHALAYGDDDETRACERNFSELFGRDVATFLTFNGTGANVLALTALARPADAVICTDWAHINVDETGDSGSNTATLTATRLTGLGMAGDDATKGIEYSSVDALNVNLGSGADVVNVTPRDDVAGKGGLSHEIAALLNVFGGGDGDTLNVDNSLDWRDSAATLTNTSLTGLTVVFYNGANDQSYAAFDLDGFSTNGAGYFTLGNALVPGVDITFADNLLQNGADAVALYFGDATSFPTGTAVTTEMTRAVANSRMPSASDRVRRKMPAAAVLTAVPKRRCSSSYDVNSSPRK